jgi:hypothetical protein
MVGMDCIHLVQDRGSGGPREHGNEPSGSTKRVEFHD